MGGNVGDLLDHERHSMAAMGSIFYLLDGAGVDRDVMVTVSSLLGTVAVRSRLAGMAEEARRRDGAA